MSNLTNADIGFWLEKARKAIGLSQEEVSRQLGIPRPAVSLIEVGKRSVSSLELDAFARFYHRNTSYFLRPKSERPSGEALLLRAQELSEAEKPAILDFIAFCEKYAALEEIVLGKKQPDRIVSYQPSPSTNTLELIKEGERVARLERARLGLGRAPVRNMLELVENQGVKVITREMKDRAISGCFYFSEECGPCIMLNSKDPRMRIAFSAAHEFCHYLLDYGMAGYICAETLTNNQPFEIRANAFAAAFLMPKEGIEEFLTERGIRKGSELPIVVIIHAQHYFGVSFEALLYRLQNTKWLKADEREHLAGYPRKTRQKLTKLLGYSEEPREHFPELPSRYIKLALTAYENGAISLQKLSEYLEKSLQETRRIVASIRKSHALGREGSS
ncbi:MAG: XRE family transcriptional regulator [Actinobacteria bacterium]|nr:XRE family transcriptional regulator [Actinomycetota bacterium]